jgi:hypothetical protein
MIDILSIVSLAVNKMLGVFGDILVAILRTLFAFATFQNSEIEMAELVGGFMRKTALSAHEILLQALKGRLEDS